MTSRSRNQAVILSILLVATEFTGRIHAEEGASPSPYIDRIRREIPETKEANDPRSSYTQALKDKMNSKSSESPESYTEQLKRDLKPESGSYIDQIKSKLEQKPEGGAIKALEEGRSELKARIDGEIHSAIGVRVGAALNRDITASPGTGSQNFNDIYGANSAPDVTLFYEYQPFHSEWYGNIGLVGSLGVSYFHGNGAFAFPLKNAGSPSQAAFPAQSKTLFQFFTLPVMAGADYRFNLARYIRPFVMAGPVVIGYYEGRNDSRNGNRGYATGFFASGGASLLLDWISSRSRWDLYAQQGVKHYYLTLEYSRLSTLSGDVNVTVSGLNAGLVFEF